MLDPASSAYWLATSVEFQGGDASVAYFEMIYNLARS